MEDKEKYFKDILAEHQDMIYRLCCSYISDVELRQDLYQNILLRIWRGLETFNNLSSLRTWIYRVSVNASIDFLRKERTQRFGV